MTITHEYQIYGGESSSGSQPGSACSGENVALVVPCRAAYIRARKVQAPLCLNLTSCRTETDNDIDYDDYLKERILAGGDSSKIVNISKGTRKKKVTFEDEIDEEWQRVCAADRAAYMKQFDIKEETKVADALLAAAAEKTRLAAIAQRKRNERLSKLARRINGKRRVQRAHSRVMNTTTHHANGRRITLKEWAAKGRANRVVWRQEKLAELKVARAAAALRPVQETRRAPVEALAAAADDTPYLSPSMLPEVEGVELEVRTPCPKARELDYAPKKQKAAPAATKPVVRREQSVLRDLRSKLVSTLAPRAVRARGLVSAAGRERRIADQARGTAIVASRARQEEHLRKTRMCRFAMAGKRCPHVKDGKSTCRFAHSAGELRVTSCAWGSACRHGQRCRFKHDWETKAEYLTRQKNNKKHNHKKHNHTHRGKNARK